MSQCGFQRLASAASGRLFWVADQDIICIELDQHILEDYRF